MSSTRSAVNMNINSNCLIFELLPFVVFFILELFPVQISDYTSYGYEILWADRSHQGGVQCTRTLTVASLSFELLPFVFFFKLEFYLVHISKTILAMAMKFCGWLQLRVSNLPLLFFKSFCISKSAIFSHGKVKSFYLYMFFNVKKF